MQSRPNLSAFRYSKQLPFSTLLWGRSASTADVAFITRSKGANSAQSLLLGKRFPTYQSFCGFPFHLQRPMDSLHNFSCFIRTAAALSDTLNRFANETRALGDAGFCTKCRD